MVSMVGRPRSFDRDDALEKAVEAFWERGYDGASISDLTAAIGIAAPSLYAAFGDKGQLFEEASGRYIERLEAALHAALAEPTARAAIERLLRETAEHHTTDDCRRGCLVMSEPRLASERAAIRDEIAARIRRGQEEGDIPATADADALADLTDLLLAGMSARARDGATLAQLEGAIAPALVAFG
jgi:AcrR family transcriptional regulator